MADITPSERYFARGTSICRFLTTIASLSTGPTRAELTAGTNLSGEIAEIDGWNVESGSIETPDLASEFTSSIPGSTSAEDSSITFYQSIDGVDVRALLPRNTNGYIVWMDGGDVEDYLMDVFPVRVASQGKTRTNDDEAATVAINFAITREPVENLAIPATV
jgi:hypothetical protein